MAASRVKLWLVAALAGCLISSGTDAPKDVCAANPSGANGQLSAPVDRMPLRLAIAGLVHGHVDGFLRAVQSRSDVDLIGIFESDPAVQRKYAQQFGLADTILFSTLEAMLDAVKPEAVASFTSTLDHVKVVEACAPRHIPVMMEKPLATTIEQARRIQRAADRGGISVMVNYETTWGAGYHPGFVELAIQPQRLRGVWRARIRSRDRRQHSSRTSAGPGRRRNANARGVAGRRTGFYFVPDLDCSEQTQAFRPFVIGEQRHRD
jgi:hypothetical protein